MMCLHDSDQDNDMTNYARSKNERQSKQDLLRQKGVELETLRSAHDELEKQIKQTLSLLNASLEATADGLLVIDKNHRTVSFNHKFLKLWQLPASLAQQKGDRALLDAVPDQLQNPEVFLKKIDYLLSHPEGESFDVLEFKDGRVFESFSKPQRIGENIVGRVWSFHDVTERTRAERALEQNKANFEAFFNSIADAAVFVDAHRRIVMINPAFTGTFGYETEDLKGESARILYANEADYDEVDGKLFHAGAAHDKPICECRYRRKDGTVFPAETVGSSVRNTKGRIIGFVTIHRDITRRKRAERALQDSEEQTRTILNSTAEAICGLDMNGNFTFCNTSFLRHMRYEKERDLLGKNMHDLIHYKHADGTPYPKEECKAYQGVMKGDGVHVDDEVFWCADGSGFSAEYWSHPMKKDGKIVGAVVTLLDISERKRMEDAIRQQAYHDTLTGLPNRILFMDHLNLAISQAHRNKVLLAVLFLDLDRFKHINDAYGHDIGDALLKEVALRLKSCVRETDTVTRIGGDEFSIILPNIDHVDDASKITEKIVSSVKQPYVLDGHELHISTSIGISIYPDDSIRPEILLRNADIAMYHAKGQGRGNYQFYSPLMKARTIERMMFENSLRKALDRGEIVVFYQPLVEIATRQLVCAEALVRWRHPVLGLLAPVQFIPLAENAGLINSIGEYVLQTACKQKKAWQEAGYPSFSVTVNLSAHEFQSPQIIERIMHILRDTRLDPQFLELEITESTAMRDTVLSSEKMEKLSDMGIRLCLDDFGIGYSSLSYLKKFPIRKLKIDQSFIRGLKDDLDDQAIVNAVVAMAHSLKITVVAEGVETDDQMSFLRACQCDQMQGYLFSEPLPVEDFQKIVMAH